MINDLKLTDKVFPYRFDFAFNGNVVHSLGGTDLPELIECAKNLTADRCRSGKVTIDWTCDNMYEHLEEKVKKLLDRAKKAPVDA